MRTMSAFNAAWFVLKARGYDDGSPIAGMGIPVKERRRMAREGQIDPALGVYPRSPDKRERKPKMLMGTNPMQGDETNALESPAMRTTEEISEMEDEQEEMVLNPLSRRFPLKSSAFDAAWVLLKETPTSRINSRYRNAELFGVPENKKDRHPQRLSGQLKPFFRNPSTSYGERNPAMTSQPSASLRTGAVPAQASQEDMDEFMRINSAQEHQDMLEAESLTDEKRSPTDEMRLDGLRSAFSSPDKAASRMAIADEMHGQDIQNIFEEQGIPVSSSVAEDSTRNMDKPRRVLDYDKELQLALRELTEFNRLRGN